MRDHATIIRDAGGASKVAGLLVGQIGGPLAALQYRVRGWVQQSSIPGDYWVFLRDLGIASLDELALAAHSRRFGAVETSGAAA